MDLKRLFLAVPLEPATRAMLAQHLGLRPLPGQPLPPENWHLTVRFLGGTDQVSQEKLMAELDQIDLGSRFEIRLAHMGAFPRPARANVLWLAVDKGIDGLTRLNDLCEEAIQAAGFAPEERPFAAHLTLSRIRPDQDVRSVIESYPPVPFRWTATELVLYESQSSKGGAVYEPLERFPLGHLGD